MESDTHFELFCVNVYAFGRADIARCGNHIRAHGFCHLESTLDLIIGELFSETVVVSIEIYSGFFEFLADEREKTERSCQPPCPAVGALQVSRLDVTAPQLTAV